MGLSNMRRLVDLFNPYRIIACYAIFCVVRADGNVKKSAVQTELEGPVQELLGKLMADGEEERLLSEISSDGRDREAAVLNHGNANDVSHQSSQRTVELPLPAVIKEPNRNALTDEPGCPKRQFCTSTGILDKPGPSSKMEVKPFLNMFSVLPILAPTSDRIRNEACRKQSRIFVHQLKRYKLWALQMYDSSAKLPSGILRGNVNQLGDFDQCLAVGTDDPSSIDGKYCLASVDVQSTKTNSKDTDSLQQAVDRAQSYGFFKSSYRDPGHFVPQFTTIKWAICVPAVCSTADVQQTLVEALQDYNETTGLRFDAHIDPDMCYVKHDTEHSLGTATVLTLAFFAAVMCVAAVATFRDARQHLQDQGQLERILMAFSVRKNVEELLAELPSEGDVNCIYGVRALCTIMLYIIHKVGAIGYTPYSNKIVFTEISNETWSTALRTALAYTDSFLLLSGLVASFSMSKEIERKKHIDWIKKYVARFIRLTPALLAVVLFYAYVMEHMGTGPLWHPVVKRNADFCKDSLWRNILYIHNLFPFEEMCATHTHHLALDMQLSLLSPLLVTLLWQWRVCGVLVLLCLHALSASLRYLATLRYHLSLVFFHGITVTKLYQTANLTYIQSLHRATSYMVGVGLGFLLHKTGKHVHIPKMAVWVGWLLAIYFAYLTLLSPSNLGLRDYEYNVHYASIYAAFSPIIWSLALAWLIWACFTGHGGFLNSFLCCRGLVVFSRISYAVYLTQFTAFFYNIGSVRASEQLTLLRSVDVVEVLTVLMASIVLTLLFDLPMQEVKSILMGAAKPHIK